MDLRLNGKRAILAGASKGIGKATAKLLAAEGCFVALCARGRESLDATVDEIRSAGGKATGAALDMSDAESYRAWIDESAAQMGGADIFACFATAGGGQPSEDSWKASFEADLMLTWRGCEAVIPHLKAAGGGSIVALSSVAAVEDFFGAQPYNAMKAALITYAAALSQQLASSGIRVNTISPGPVLFEGGTWDRIRREKPDIFQAMTAKIPVGRMASAEEIASAIAFLCSPLSGSTTGTNLVIDGGFTKRVQF